MTTPWGSAHSAIQQVVREEYGLVLAHLIRVFGGDFQLAEDALQDALTTALERWPADGVPERPAAWLTTAARRKGTDRVRRRGTRADKLPELTQLAEFDAMIEPPETEEIPDEQLRLFFTCCHPTLAAEAQVALTLRTLGGLTTDEVAAAFLVPPATMAQRLVRAKKKIKLAGIPYRVPPRELLDERTPGVLAALYLIFNEGYSASSGDELVRRELCTEAIRLARTLVGLMPDEPEAIGLLALMLLTDARRDARVDAEGLLVPLTEQDRSLWSADAIAEGSALTRRALLFRQPGPYQLQAAIAAVHSEARDTGQVGWHQIALLYDRLASLQPSPVVRLNHAVAVSFAASPQTGLVLLEPLGAALDSYQPFHAARADMLRRAGRTHEAHRAYDRAIALAGSAPQRRWLQRKKRQAG